MYVKITSLLALLALATASNNEANDERNLRNNRGPCPNGSEKVVINFDRLADGTKTTAGEEVSDQWDPKYGVTFKGTRGNRRELNNQGQRNKPVLRLFDSSSPQHKNRNFGSPNERCEGCGNNNKDCPGVANHSYKDIAAHTNCDEQNRVLIIDSGRRLPDPFHRGGQIEITFDPPATKLLSFSSMGLLPENSNQLSGPSSSTYTIITGTGQEKPSRKIQSTGNNGWGIERIDFTHPNDIGKLILDIDGDFAMTHLQFCMPTTNYH